MEDINSIYKIKTRTLILTEYNEFLYQLYLPLIGHRAVFLYEYLTNELRYGKKTLTLEEIANRSSLNVQDFIFERKMLESIGLISTFNSNLEFIIILNPILSPKNFFADDVLKGLFMAKVGKKRGLEVMKHYQIDDNDEGFKEITASINDNFLIDFEFDDLKVGNDLKLLSTNKINRNDDFDDAFFLKQLSKISNIRCESITPLELKKIHNIGVVYNLNEKIIAEMVRDCFDVTAKVGEKIDFEVLNERAISEVVAAKSFNRKKKKDVKISSSSDASKKIEYYQSVSPREFLKARQDGVEPIASDLHLIQYLANNMDFDYSVINVILDYSLSKCGNLLVRSFVEKVAATLKRSKCETCLDALNVLYKSNSNKDIIKKEENNDDNYDFVDLEDII
ncbi:MAG: hypothetical protein SOV26_01645 [Candidatus Onthovivens sp.]|nr:hypothetical protein [Candidatus Onthovivens sp.]